MGSGYGWFLCVLVGCSSDSLVDSVECLEGNVRVVDSVCSYPDGDYVSRLSDTNNISLAALICVLERVSTILIQQKLVFCFEGYQNIQMQ